MSKLNSIDNYNKPFPSTLRTLIDRKKTTIKAVADYIGVSRQAVSQYQDGSTQPNAETIVKMAEFFNVTTDYLLTGKNSNVDESFNIACDYTGLSPKAVEKIVSWKRKNDFSRFWCQHLSSIVEAEEIENILLDISQILGFSKLEAKAINENDAHLALDVIDMQTARLWYISKTFTDIIEEMAKIERLKGGEDIGNNK